MYRLIKIELEYFKVPLFAIVLILLSFTYFALNDIRLFSEIDFLKKYFWSMVVGLGSYGLIYYLWTQRVREKHERMIYLLPISLNSKKWSRWIFAVLPYLFVMIFIQILYSFLPEDWNQQIGRISAQVGLLSMALAGIFIIRDYWFTEQQRGESFKVVVASAIILIAAIGAVAIIRISSYDIIPPIYIYQEEMMFFVWGIIISSMALLFYVKRKNYLE